jgi:acetyl-CoA carboxylase carboxyl transferase subunit alpha
LWRNWNNKERAADALKLTATDMNGLQLVDGIVKEPLGGAHTNPAEIFETVKEEILKNLSELNKLTPEERVDQRIDKFCSMGVYKNE